MLKFKFFEDVSIEDLESEVEEYCKENEIWTKYKLVKVYNHSVVMPMFDINLMKEFPTIINKVMIVWDNGKFPDIREDHGI